jgi:hypothetical protein
MGTSLISTEAPSLSDLMETAFQISLKLAYEDMAPDGTYLTPRSCRIGNAEQESMVSSWCDGLVHKYYRDRAIGHCSIRDMVDFDIAKFEDSVVRDIETMKKLLKELGTTIQLDFAEMQRRGYTGSWAGLPSNVTV